MKTTFDSNLDLYQAVKQQGQKHKSQEKLSIKKNVSLITFKLVFRKKLVNNQNLNK